jgi:hypothetical protein
MRILTSRAIGTAAAAAIALSTLTVQPASAQNSYGNSDAMAAATMIAAFSMIATAIIVSNQERRAHRHVQHVGHHHGHSHHPRGPGWRRFHRR